MEAISTTIALSNFSNPKGYSLAEWNARYEAMSLEQDWWFKAAMAVAAFARASIRWASKFTTTPALRAARA